VPQISAVVGSAHNWLASSSNKASNCKPIMTTRWHAPARLRGDYEMASSARRSDGRPHDTGLIRPMRPCPADFRETYLQLGQDRAIEDHYRTNWRVIRRWIEESGGDELRAERHAISGGSPRPRLRAGNRARRYVLGLRLTPSVRSE
jgi:hypothetical protein